MLSPAFGSVEPQDTAPDSAGLGSLPQEGETQLDTA